MRSLRPLNSSEAKLHKNQIQPPIELVPDLMQVSCFHEAHSFVQLQARFESWGSFNQERLLNSGCSRPLIRSCTGQLRRYTLLAVGGGVVDFALGIQPVF
jgi:hypothetical protein